MNLALNKTAWLNTTHSAQYSADRAVDGNRNPHHSIGTCAISAEGETSATWGVDLASIYSIHRIDIYYRGMYGKYISAYISKYFFIYCVYHGHLRLRNLQIH